MVPNPVAMVFDSLAVVTDPAEVVVVVTDPVVFPYHVTIDQDPVVEVTYSVVLPLTLHILVQGH